MKKLKQIPDGLKEIKEVYGDPDVDDDFTLDEMFLNDRLVYVKAPYPMRLSWRPASVVKTIQCHESVAESLLDALTAVRDYKGEAYLYDHKYDYWGGCFCFRKMTGYNALSTHSWGIAVDVCPHIGRYGNTEDAITFPEFIVKAFEERGWEWGGRWRPPWHPDPMHFQACRSY